MSDTSLPVPPCHYCYTVARREGRFRWEARRIARKCAQERQKARA